MVTEGAYMCGEHSKMHQELESLCCTPESNVTLCINYIQILKIKKKKKETGKKK